MINKTIFVPKFNGSYPIKNIFIPRNYMNSIIQDKNPMLENIEVEVGWYCDECGVQPNEPYNKDPTLWAANCFHVSVITYVGIVKNIITAIKIDKNIIHSCKICKTSYPMSNPNQSDGTLICWSCRQGWYPGKK